MEQVLKSVSDSWLPAVLLIAALMPFWYISLYLFHKGFYDKSTQVLKWAFSFCFSFIWFTISAYKALIDLIYRGLPDGNSDGTVIPLIESPVGLFYFRAGGYAIITLTLSIAAGYFIAKQKRTDIFVKLFLIAGGLYLFSVITSLVAYKLLY